MTKCFQTPFENNLNIFKFILKIFKFKYILNIFYIMYDVLHYNGVISRGYSYIKKYLFLQLIYLFLHSNECKNVINCVNNNILFSSYIINIDSCNNIIIYYCFYNLTIVKMILTKVKINIFFSYIINIHISY